MSAAHDQRAEALKESAVLRSLAEQVVSPVAAGRKSRRALSQKQRGQWGVITDRVVTWPSTTTALPPEVIAGLWKQECKAAGIGAGLFGWLVWNWAFPLLLELAKLWIESKRNNMDSSRD